MKKKKSWDLTRAICAERPSFNCLRHGTVNRSSGAFVRIIKVRRRILKIGLIVIKFILTNVRCECRIAGAKNCVKRWDFVLTLFSS
jgi:hypothetical protein